MPKKTETTSLAAVQLSYEIRCSAFDKRVRMQTCTYYKHVKEGSTASICNYYYQGRCTCKAIKKDVIKSMSLMTKLFEGA